MRRRGLLLILGVYLVVLSWSVGHDQLILRR